ncbi:MAG: hypothetical protein E3K38_12525 [Candidatus Kuenenia stuttgartiensis]|nr:hypothetical protein [Candidatus Kuenenia stuttgartiensis]
MNESGYNIAFAESMCSDGMCCFTCVIPANSGHIGFIKYFLKRGSGFRHVKLLAMSEGRRNELYESCRFLDVIISADPEALSLKMDLRCRIYKYRPVQCMDYPDCAGAASGQEITGPCIYNEYNTSGAYQQLVYKREWKAFFAIRNDLTALRGIFSGNEVSATREILLNVKGVCLAEISVGSEKQDFILIPLPKRTENILYLSEKHQPITTIEDAYRRWDEKIKGNLLHHYGTEWNKKLEEAIRMEGKDVSKGNNE